jgi:peptide/nickel transport system permease protein
VGVVLLGTLALVGLFAECLAGDAPIAATGPSGIALFPGVLHARAFEALAAEEIARRYEGDVTLWPPVRSGPTKATAAGPSATSSRAHPLGTDRSGRDLFARLVYGARTALGLSAVAVLIALVLGTLLGGLAGYGSSFWNDRVLRLVETVDTFPTIIVVAIVRAIEDVPSALSLVLAVALVRSAEIARLVRGEVLRASIEGYVLAARALGASPTRVLVRHILPNAAGPAIVSSIFGVASIVLIESALSFLGLGAPRDGASWGETLAEGAAHPEQLRLILLPSLLLSCTIGGSYLLADALRDALDPRASRRACGKTSR